MVTIIDIIGITIQHNDTLGALIHHPKKYRSLARTSKYLKVFRQAQAFYSLRISMH